MQDLKRPTMLDLPENPRERILEFLKMEPRLTTSQISRLMPEPRRGTPLKPFITKPNREFPPSYPRTRDMLATLLKREQIKRWRDHASESYLFCLPEVDIPTNFYNRQHEIDCGDLFVAYFNTGKLQYWDALWQEDEKGIKDNYRVWYDRRFQLDDKLFFLEVDRGTEDLDAFETKIKKYLKLAQDHQGVNWYVLITVQ